MTETHQGYSVVDDVFARSEMIAALADLSAAAVQRTRAGARHVLNVPIVRALSTDPRMLKIAGEFVGPSPLAFRATLFDKSSMANWLVVWHQDTALPLRNRIEHEEWGPWSTKDGTLYAHAPAWALEQVIALRVSLDDSSPTNGPLRVLPGTDRGGIYSDDEIERLVQSTAPVDCLVRSGGVIAMRPLIVHASSKSRDDRPRRVLHIEYSARVNLGSGIQLAVG